MKTIKKAAGGVGKSAKAATRVKKNIAKTTVVIKDAHPKDAHPKDDRMEAFLFITFNSKGSWRRF
jgi:hypothetical protein